MQVTITVAGTQREMRRMGSALFCAQMDADGNPIQGEGFDLMRQVQGRISDETTTLVLTVPELVAAVRGAELAATDQLIHPGDAAAYAEVRDGLYGVQSAAVATR